MQPMSCTDADAPENLPEEVVIEREVELPAPPDAVWRELPGMLGDDVHLVAEPGGPLRVVDSDGVRSGVVDDVIPGRRLTFSWARVDGNEPPSEVELELEPTIGGTRLRVCETRLDGAQLARAAFSARARA